MQRFEVRKDNLAETRLTDSPVEAVQDGEILVRVERFALTANNVTYGVVGERIGYWQFFPATDGWGVIPVWGFAEVVESRHPDVAAGERLYGFLPMATHLKMLPERINDERLVDGAPHRAELPPVYNAYRRVDHESPRDPSMDDERMLLFPLYATSFCIADFLEDNDWFGATQVIVGSASSKTAIGLAYALADAAGAPAAIGLTSAGNADRVRGLDLYDSVVTYDRLSDVDAEQPAVIVDMSGSGTVLSDLHAHLGDNMRFTSQVGITHYEDNDMGPHVIRERSAMFFAPAHIQKRAKDWGPGEFERRAFAFWHKAAIRSRDWLGMDRREGPASLTDAWGDVLGGRVPADRGVVVAL